jgi:hypothetical protein
VNGEMNIIDKPMVVITTEKILGIVDIPMKPDSRHVTDPRILITRLLINVKTIMEFKRLYVDFVLLLRVGLMVPR